MENENMNYEVENSTMETENEYVVPTEVQVTEKKNNKGMVVGAIVGATAMAVGIKAFGFIKKKLARKKAQNEIEESGEETSEQE